MGSVGLNCIHTFENDTGPDDANHAVNGIFIMYNPHYSGHGGRKLEGLQLMDVAPTVLDLMGLPVPADMEGKVIGSDE